MATTIRERQEVKKLVDDQIVEIKDDIERLFELGEYSQLGLYDLYQKIDAVGQAIEDVLILDLNDPVATKT